MWIWIWLGVVAVSLIIEFLTMEIVSIWFAVGGIIAMILQALKVPVHWQIIIFIIVSTVLMLLLRKVSLKYLNSKEDKTNVDSLIGKKLKLLSDITSETSGTVKINDVVWTAVSDNEDEEIKAGSHVIVVAIKGNKIIVNKLEDENIKE